MAAISDEDVELRELLVSNLESRGILSKIKAELRAAIFQCLDDKPTSDATRSDDSRIQLSICADTLRRLGLLNSLKVLEAEATSVLTSPIMTCSEVEDVLGIEHTPKPILNSLLTTKHVPAKDSSNILQQLKEKARAEFNGYDHSNTNKIHIDDAPNALLDAVPFVPESIARAIFSSTKFNSELTFEAWWDEIKQFYTIAQHLSSGTEPDKDLSDLTADLKLDLTRNGTKQASGDFIGSTQLTNRSSTAPVSYTRDEFTEDFESRTEKTESEIEEDEITGGQLPDSGSESDFHIQSSNHQPLKNQDLTEDFSLRSDEMSKYADFMENV